MGKSGVGAKNEKIDKFFEMLGDRLTPEPAYKGLYSFEEKVFVELHPVEGDVEGWKNSSCRMLKMFRLYTIPEHRGYGLGGNVVEIVKEAADGAGVVIFLRANGFTFLSRPTVLEMLNGWDSFRCPAIIESRGDVLKHWGDQPRLATDRLFGEYSNETILDWYVKLGFRRWFCGASAVLNTGPRHAVSTDAALYCPAKVRIPKKVEDRLRKRAYGWQAE
ncbi:MAG: hypothetical protein ACO23R_14550 [bacterium]